MRTSECAERDVAKNFASFSYLHGGVGYGKNHKWSYGKAYPTSFKIGIFPARYRCVGFDLVVVSEEVV